VVRRGRRWSLARWLHEFGKGAGRDGKGSWGKPTDASIDAPAGLTRPHLPARVDPRSGPVPVAYESAGRIHLARLRLTVGDRAPGQRSEDANNGEESP
jgi:hypothetical protein